MKKIRKPILIMLVVLALILFNSCTKDSPTPTKGNLIIWTKLSKYIGDPILITKDSVVGNVNYGPKRIDIGDKRITKVITTYKPVCGDTDSINIELETGSYNVNTYKVISSEVTIFTSTNYIQIHSDRGDCDALEIR